MSSIHAGSQLRWYEQLCRIQFQQLRLAATTKARSLAAGRLPGVGGVYCFWWTGDIALLSDPSCNRQLDVAGPGGRRVTIDIDDEWLGLQTKLPVPLYVGKNADSISSRVGQHLMLGNDRVTPIFEGYRKQERPTTSCQARAGVEHLFPQLPNTRDLMLDNVGISWVELGGDDHAVNRFYLEDLAIGLMRPILNVDVER
jgi:hypothetical protein